MSGVNLKGVDAPVLTGAVPDMGCRGLQAAVTIPDLAQEAPGM